MAVFWSRMGVAQRTHHQHVAEEMREAARVANPAAVAELVHEIESLRNERGGACGRRLYGITTESLSPQPECPSGSWINSSSSLRGSMPRLTSFAQRTT
jgi:hypothetical protein